MAIQDEDVSWAGYRRLVISELERVDRSIGSLREEFGKTLKTIISKIDESNDGHNDEIAKLKTAIAVLQVKATFFGAAGGLTITVTTEILLKLFGGK